MPSRSRVQPRRRAHAGRRVATLSFAPGARPPWMPSPGLSRQRHRRAASPGFQARQAESRIRLLLIAVQPGPIIKVAAWTLDPAPCADTKMGTGEAAAAGGMPNAAPAVRPNVRAVLSTARTPIRSRLACGAVSNWPVLSTGLSAMPRRARNQGGVFRRQPRPKSSILPTMVANGADPAESRTLQSGGQGAGFI